jgi:Raf kinase inhibitor-like YbhB/YbcL family protein
MSSIMPKLTAPKILGTIGLLAAWPLLQTMPVAAAEPFGLISSAFADGDMVPLKYAGAHPARSCGGQNISPALTWVHAPAATRSFAIVMFDPDGGRGTGSNHWVAYDLPPEKTSLAEGEASRSPTEWTGGRNTVGTDHYFGPCGPAGDQPHHYVITVIATDLASGNLRSGLTREQLLAELRGHALAPASIVGKFVRPQ